MHRLILINKPTNEIIGYLWQESGGWKFCYSPNWEKYRLAGNLPIKHHHVYFSKELFPYFLERIPIRNNSYRYLCKRFGIPENETNLEILLSTIGSEGTDSVVIRPEHEDSKRPA